MITPQQQQQAQAMLKSVGYTPPVQPSGSPSWYSQVMSATPTPTTSDTTTQPVNNTFGNGQNNTGNFAGVDTVNNAGSDILNAISGGVQTFGHALSTINLKNISPLLPTTGAADTANKINTQDNASKGLLLAAIHNQTDPAKQAQMLMAYNQIWGGKTPLTAGDINPAYNMSGEKIAGSALETALDVIGAGSLPGAAEGATTTSGIVKGALQGAKAGATTAGALGVGFGASQGMQNNESPLGVAGSAALGGGIGVVGGGLLGGLTGGISGGMTAAAQRNAILGAKETDGLVTPIDQTIKANPDLAPTIEEAQKQGLSDKDINFLATASPEDKPTMQKMLALAESAQTNARQIERPLDVVGDNGTALLGTVQDANDEAGQKLNTIAKGLQGQTVDATDMHDQAMEILSNAGVTENANGTPNWKTSQFAKTPALQKQLMNALSDLPNGETDALDLHNFKQSLYNLSDYGTQGEGLSGRADGIVKQIAHLADGVLDDNFPEYAQVNTDYGTTKNLLDRAQSIIGKKVDFTTDAGSQSFGQSLRSAFSNNKSRGAVLQFINDLQGTANDYGANYKGNLLDQALFSTILEDNFGSPAVTGLSGEVGKAIDNTKTAIGIIKHPISGTLGAVGDALEKAQGINPENKIAVLKALIK